VSIETLKKEEPYRVEPQGHRWAHKTMVSCNVDLTEHKNSMGSFQLKAPKFFSNPKQPFMVQGKKLALVAAATPETAEEYMQLFSEVNRGPFRVAVAVFLVRVCPVSWVGGRVRGYVGTWVRACVCVRGWVATCVRVCVRGWSQWWDGVFFVSHFVTGTCTTRACAFGLFPLPWLRCVHTRVGALT
jgi:hypothetical protein